MTRIGADAEERTSLRPIEPGDDPRIASIIRTVMPEFGAVGEGFSIMDPEVDAMHEAYAGEDAAYFVALVDGEVVGGAGVGPLVGGPPDVCELKKMYLLPDARGLGLGRRLLERCLDAARARDTPAATWRRSGTCGRPGASTSATASWRSTPRWGRPATPAATAGTSATSEREAVRASPDGSALRTQERRSRVRPGRLARSATISPRSSRLTKVASPRTT